MFNLKCIIMRSNSFRVLRSVMGSLYVLRRNPDLTNDERLFINSAIKQLLFAVYFSGRSFQLSKYLYDIGIFHGYDSEI